MSVDLSTRYLGMTLRNPLVVAASPLSERLEMLRRLEDAGAAAAVLPSLFEEQIDHQELQVVQLQDYGAESFAEALSYFPDLEDYNAGPDRYLKHIESAKDVVSIPLIASLNGVSRGGWVRYARRMQDAGANAIELNIYLIATDPDASSADVEARYLDLIAAVREAVTIPLAVKLGPYFSSFPHFARRVVAAGANGLVLFNRFLQPDIDLETLQVAPNLVLSSQQEMRLPLRWIAILKGRIEASLAATTGIHTVEDVIKMILAGADVTMLASALIRNGPKHLRTLLDGLRCWLEGREYASIEQMKGSLSQQNCPDPAAFERANYMKALVAFTGGVI